MVVEVEEAAAVEAAEVKPLQFFCRRATFESLKKKD